MFFQKEVLGHNIFSQIHRAYWGCACADASAINHRLGDLNSIYYCRKSPFFTVLLIRHSTGITISNNKRLWEASQNWNLLYLSKIETLEKKILFQLRVPLMFPPLGLLINYVVWIIEGDTRSHINSAKCFQIHSLHIKIFCLGQIDFGKYYVDLQLA